MSISDSRSPRGTPAFALGLAAVGSLAAGLAVPAAAHEPIAHCVLLDPATVRCRGGFGHGEGAAGSPMDVIDHDGRVLVAGVLDADSTLTFARPAGRYYVLFDVGPGHQAVVEDDEIGRAPASPRARWMRADPPPTVSAGAGAGAVPASAVSASALPMGATPTGAVPGAAGAGASR